jgi:hypothetical protein
MIPWAANFSRLRCQGAPISTPSALASLLRAMTQPEGGLLGQRHIREILVLRVQPDFCATAAITFDGESAVKQRENDAAIGRQE